MKTVVGLYSGIAEANKVKTALEGEGFEKGRIQVIDQTGSSEGSAAGSTAGSGESFTTKVKDFFSGFSEHKDEHAEYSKSIGSGGALLAVTVPDNEAEKTADLLYEHGATGIQGDYSAGSGATGGGAEDVAVLEGNTGRAGYADTTSTNTTAAAGEQVIPIVQEGLVVGKRDVERGGVRIYSHVVEEPVSADVTLRDERVFVERTAVNRAATDADFTTGTGVVELTATGEEAVVGKTSRVVEEVRVAKQASEHTEQINETVRHTEVDVEPVTTTGTGTTSTGTTTTKRGY